MRHDPSASIAHILAATWHQRRNSGGLWGIVAVVGFCAAAPVGLLAWSLVAHPLVLVERLRHGAMLSASIGAIALLASGWAMLIGTVLQQNHPALARLVPGHVARLRTALLVAWAALVLAITAGPGFAMDAPLLCACGAAGGLALLACALRWPLLWLLGIVAPFAMRGVLAVYESQDIDVALVNGWAHQSWLITAVVATAGALMLVAIVRSGGRSHLAAYEAGRAVARAFGMGSRAVAPSVALPAVNGLRAIASRPYDWWMAHVLARGDSAPSTRLQLALGPSLHWVSRVGDIFWTIAFGGVALALFATNTGVELRAAIFAWASFSVLLTLGAMPTQTPARLRKTQREQALLLLLPGAPRGDALSRWLALRLTLQGLLAAGAGLLLSWGLATFAEATSPGALDLALGGIGPLCAVTLLPMLMLLWRRWAWLQPSSSFDNVPPLFAQVALGLLALALHLVTGASYLAVGIGFAAFTGAWCAWRWGRMAREPAAMPVGRLA